MCEHGDAAKASGY